MTDEEMAEVLGLKKRTLAKTRRALGLLRQQPARWQREELEFLQKNYSRLTQEEIAQQLERSLKAVNVKASRLGLKKRRGRPV
jgi:DNA-binding XRE family transcriptional regulator